MVLKFSDNSSVHLESINGYQNAEIEQAESTDSDKVADCNVQGHIAIKSSMNDERHAIIKVRHGVKQFGGKSVPVIQELNMTVFQGNIYTLLGSSGCGKTTLLSCILGLQNLDSGQILVFGKTPGCKGSGVPGPVVGYMPQETSLYPSLTIGEQLDYFGILCGMSVKNIKERSNFLTEFLQLPNASQVCSSLSGGQKRRTSFAVALMADPPLLILDEPTVGVDALLREKIWDYLVDLVAKKKTTVIITTHYLEESRRSDTIGFMRNGRLLTEQSPQSLLDQYGTSQITHALLQLCQNETNSDKILFDLIAESENECAAQYSATNNFNFGNCSGLVKSVLDAKTHLCAMVKKNVLLMTRSYMILLFLICCPGIQAILFCLAVGNTPSHLPFGVVNIEASTKNETCQISTNPTTCSMGNLGCQFLLKIPEDILSLHYFATEHEAKENLDFGRIWGYIIIPENFSSNLLSSWIPAPNDNTSNSQIVLKVDATSKQITATYSQAFADAFQNLSRDLQATCGFEKKGMDLPIHYSDPVFGSFDSPFQEFLVPSIIIGILFFYPTISSSMQCIQEKKQGTYQRGIACGVKTWEILMSYSVTESFIVLVQSFLGFCIISYFFHIKIRGSICLVFLLCILIGLSGVSVGFLIGGFCREETEAALLSMAVFFPNFILSGMFWPMEGLPMALQYISSVLPCTLAGEGLRSIISRGWGFCHPKVWPGFAIPGAWVLFFWGLNVIVHWISKKRK